MSLSCTGTQADPSSRATGDVCFGEALSHAPHVRDEGVLGRLLSFPTLGTISFRKAVYAKRDHRFSIVSRSEV